MTARAPLYENMKFPPYEFQEYPKVVNVPEGLEDKFKALLVNVSMENMLFSHDREGNTVNKINSPIKRQIMVNNSDEELALLEKFKAEYAPEVKSAETGSKSSK